ncbi:hypothetical protein AB1Y20_004866 [Prymnesium parvum]|uniref:SNF2 N-terminal domain-containing protein n=1 Tax=Prymnesium parvum TaxID=97485 RepID=A0AB34IXC1_PRYPA
MLRSRSWCGDAIAAELTPTSARECAGCSGLTGGGILGDEPGLGKTLQAVASVEALVTAQLVSHVLIVVTAEMVANWAVEFKKFSVEGSVDLICIQREVASLHAMDHLRRLVNVNAPDHSVVIVSYEEILLNTGTICLNTVKYSSF